MTDDTPLKPVTEVPVVETPQPIPTPAPVQIVEPVASQPIQTAARINLGGVSPFSDVDTAYGRV